MYEDNNTAIHDLQESNKFIHDMHEAYKDIHDLYEGNNRTPLWDTVRKMTYWAGTVSQW